MKKLIALATTMLMSGAFAQSYDSDFGSPSSDYGTGSGSGSTSFGTGAGDSGYRHMIGFTLDSSLLGVFSLDKSKIRGEAADNDTQFNLDLNYAYSLPMMPRLQIGGRALYEKDVDFSGDFENWGFDIGAYLNHTDDLKNSLYASLFVGLLWNNNYNAGSSDDEVMSITLALGKRFSLEHWGVKHLTYTPEIALENKKSTTNRAQGSFDYSQDLQFRFLQFSVLF